MTPRPQSIRLAGVMLLAALSAGSCQRMEWYKYNSEGAMAFEQGRCAEAERWMQAALREAEKFGSTDGRLATSLDNLGELYRAQGRYAEAEPLYKRALTILERTSGPDDPNVGGGLGNLAEFYRVQGRYAEAEPLYVRSLAISEKALGVDHPDVPVALERLADFYRSQGRYAEARPLYQRSVRTWEKILGREHPYVATSLEKYAALLRDMDRESEAAAAEARAKAIRSKNPGRIPSK